MVVFESWIDRQIREAIERGDFDNLPGAGQPIPGLDGRRDDDWWIKQKLEREGVRPPPPGTLGLRREVAAIDEAVADCRSEDQVREIVADLNARIVDSVRRGVDGPRLPVRTADVAEVLERWRARRGGRGR